MAGDLIRGHGSMKHCGCCRRSAGAATAMPPADGAWLNPETDRLVLENVVLVYTFVDPDRFEQRLTALRRLLHRLGRETNQGRLCANSKDSCSKSVTTIVEMTMATGEPGRGGTKRRIALAGPTKRRVHRTGLLQALGAASANSVQSTVDTPLGFAVVRQALMANLRSTGGRPGLGDAERRKIPIPESVWRLVSDAAAQMAEPGFHPSAAQVASAILSMAVQRMDPQLQRDAKHALKPSRSLEPDGAVRAG